jgi:hypothetical protein
MVATFFDKIGPLFHFGWAKYIKLSKKNSCGLSRKFVDGLETGVYYFGCDLWGLALGSEFQLNPFLCLLEGDMGGSMAPAWLLG